MERRWVGSPPPPSARAVPGTSAAGCPLGSWHTSQGCEHPDSAGGPLCSLGLPLVVPGFCPRRRCRNSPHACLSSLQLVPKRPAAGQEEPGWGRRPLGRTMWSLGSGNPGQLGYPFPAASSGRCWRGRNSSLCSQRVSSATGKLGRLLEEGLAPRWALLGVWLQLLSPLPPPNPRLWWPRGAVIPHPAPFQQSSGGRGGVTDTAVIPRAECCWRQPRATSSGGNQGGLLGGGSRCQCCGSGSD